MQPGDQHATGGDLPGPPEGARPDDALPRPDLSPAASPAPVDAAEPHLPPAGAIATSPTPEPPSPNPGAGSWYRTDTDRFRSVNRLANPWYRRLARGVVGMTFLAAAGVGLFFGAKLVQDLLDRERLPAEGAEVPRIRDTTFEIRSTTPAPVLDGTLTLDAESGAYEFRGRGTGSQAGAHVVNPDGTTVYVRRNETLWSTASAGDQVVVDVQRAVGYLFDDDSADDILTRQLRRGYVELIDRAEIGDGDDELRRYEMRLDTASFQDNFPLDFQAFEEGAIPGVQAVRGLPVTITLDRNDVLVGVVDSSTNWSWQRLEYSDQPFQPTDPGAEAVDGSIEVTDGSIDDG